GGRRGGDVKRTVVAIVIGLAVVAVLTVITGIWLLRFRPLSVYGWTTRVALARAGLHKVSVSSPAGLQVVWTGGRGPVLVLLHGAGDQAGTWSRVVPALVKTHTLVVPDLAGHGDSAPGRGPIEVKAVYEGVVAAIDTLAPGQRVIIVGNSLGGWMAMLVARRRPERVAMVVCVDGGAIRGGNDPARVLPKTRTEARQSVAQTRDPKSAPIPDYVLDDIVRQATGGPLARFASTASSMGAFVLDEAALREIKTPVRLIWGASDRLMPLDYARRMAAALPDVRLDIVDACGHVPQVECPDRFLTALWSALAGGAEHGSGAASAPALRNTKGVSP
ncbi:MAG TPA: alpha/beta hydrolase, partial [Coriobacteriia bacterium]